MRVRLLCTALALIALASAVPGSAVASSTQESMLMDDLQLIYSNPARTWWALQQAKALGIDRVKVSVVWTLMVPNPNSTKAPAFDASDPAAYPPGAWNRYDTIVQDARALGLKVFFQIVPPAPAWAVARRQPTQGYPWSQKPSTSAFGKFVEAIARRYSGSYIPPGAASAPPQTPPGSTTTSTVGLPVTVPAVGSTTTTTTTTAAPAQQPQPLPRVDYWGIWNEPNEGAWLNPQWRKIKGNPDRLWTAPAMYRGLVDAAYGALKATGHANDTILIGETASHGWIYPLTFVQALYCVSSSNRPLTGRRAIELRCPGSGNRAAFVAAHPGLFAISGFAHHPYSFDVPPDTRMQDHKLVTLQNLGVLERALGRAYDAYGRHRRGGVPLYLDEWGYKTNPPNPFVRTSLSEQAAWLNQGEYMTWKDPYVRSLAQFLLVDDHPKAGERVGSRQYWGTFQTGLLYVNGAQKPSYDAFRLPIWLPRARHGRAVSVWGQLRPADHSKLQWGVLEFRPRKAHAWSYIRFVATNSWRGFFLTSVAIPAAGSVRLAWLDPSGATYYSRTVSVS